MDDAERNALAQMRRGQIDGLEVLVRRYQDRAVRAAFIITRDRAQAEDVVQAAFIRAFERIHQYDPARPFGPWFLRMVTNDAIKVVTGQRAVSLDAEDEASGASLADLLAETGPDVLTRIEAAETSRLIWDTLGRLSPTQRAVIVLRYYLDMDDAEIVHVTQSPPGTIRWRLHAAREQLRLLLAPLFNH